jgi:hypothetical protein
VETGQPDPADRKKEVERTREMFRVTAELGGKYCRVLSGQNRPGLNEAEALRWVIDCLWELEPHARAAGVWMCMENHYKDNLWTYQTTDGRSIKKAIEYLYPFIADKTKWPHKQDIMYWENWPVAQPFLLFGADTYKNKEWFDTWKKLDHSPVVEAVIRNLPIRNPLIWIN